MRSKKQALKKPLSNPDNGHFHVKNRIAVRLRAQHQEYRYRPLPFIFRFNTENGMTARSTQRQLLIFIELTVRFNTENGMTARSTKKALLKE